MQPEAERTIIASVAVDQSVITIDRLFDYIVPAHLVGKALTGSRALVRCRQLEKDRYDSKAARRRSVAEDEIYN